MRLIDRGRAGLSLSSVVLSLVGLVGCASEGSVDAQGPLCSTTEDASSACLCAEGLDDSGQSCADVLDVCVDVECSGHGTCLASDAGPVCICDEGYTSVGMACDPIPTTCDEVTCSGHGACEVVDDRAICQCDDGYEPSGTSCVAVPVDACDGVTCSGHGYCDVVDDEAECNCETGYVASGIQCLATVGPCRDIDCSGHGSCEVVAELATCQCDDGYEAAGAACVAVAVDPCDTITCSGHGTCTSVTDQAQCTCDEGYTVSGTQCLATSGPCKDVDCSGHGTCEVVGDVASCQCESGFEPSGETCVAVAPDPCQSVNCSGHGTCAVVGGIAECDCDTGYEASGTGCVATSGACAGVTCSDHGTCDATGGAAVCLCDPGYESAGTTCMEIDPCAGVTCSGRGTCDSVSPGVASCLCLDGYRSVGTSCVPEGDPCTYVDCPEAKECGTGEQELFVSSAFSGTELGTLTQPFKTVQAALDAAADGTVIHVAEGTYVESVWVQDKEVHLCGGWSEDFATRDTSAYRPVIRGASSSAPVVGLVDARHSTVVGFEIREGQSGVWVETLAWPEDAAQSDPRLSDNIITANGALTLDEQTHGGVLMLSGYLSLIGNVIQGNRGSKGSGLMLAGAEVLVQANMIIDNVGGSDHGGGIYDGTDNSILSSNLIQGNEVGALVGWGWGGGMIVLGHATLNGNVWTDNYAPSHGGALFVDEAGVALLSNDLFFANRCSSEGGDAMALDGGENGRTHVTATNITVADHDCNGLSSILMEANSELNLMNSIVWSPSGTTDIYFQENNCSVDVSYSDFKTVVRDGVDGNVLVLGPGNINADPLFADPTSHDYHLKSAAGRFDVGSEAWVTDSVTSPAIDKGNPSSNYELEPTPNGGRADMGAYGDTDQASLSQQ